MFSGINVVKRYLRDGEGKPHLFIFKNCVNLISEIKSYWWGDNDLPIKKDDHCLDEMRYYLMSICDRPKSQPKKSVIEKDIRAAERQGAAYGASPRKPAQENPRHSLTVFSNRKFLTTFGNVI